MDYAPAAVEMGGGPRVAPGSQEGPPVFHVSWAPLGNLHKKCTRSAKYAPGDKQNTPANALSVTSGFDAGDLGGLGELSGGNPLP